MVSKFLLSAMLTIGTVGCVSQAPRSCDEMLASPDAACSLSVEPCAIDAQSVNVGAVTPLKQVTVHHDCNFNIAVTITENNTVGDATMNAPGDEVHMQALAPGDELVITPNLQAGAPGPFEIVCNFVASGDAPVAGKDFTVYGEAE